MVIAYKVYCFDSRNIVNEKIMGNAEFIFKRAKNEIFR